MHQIGVELLPGVGLFGKAGGAKPSSEPVRYKSSQKRV